MGALIDQDVFCVHGGLSPQLPFIEKVSLLDRQVELPPDGPLCDLCWSDTENVPDWRENTRGAGFLFGPTQTTKFTRINRLQFVARSHQLCMEGSAKYFGDTTTSGKGHEYRVITIWSAPNYSYRSGNKATVMMFRFKGGSGKSADWGDREDHLLTIPVNPKRIEPPAAEMPVGQYFS
jgi:diadenosine tetraphosphatase ApaH/serine/threonine PP2A family protein phosphatase